MIARPKNMGVEASVIGTCLVARIYAHQMDDHVDFFKVTDITIITQIRDVFFQLKILTPVKVTIVTKVTDITGIFLGCHNIF